MSWNTGLQVNNLATKLNNLSKSVITNPLTSTLNANNQGISNVSNIAIQSLKDSTGTNGTTDQILTVAPSGLSIWKSPIVSTVFYVDGTSGSNTNLGSQTFPFKTIQYALNKCTSNTIYYTIYVNPYNGPTGYPEVLTISNPRLNLIGVQSNGNTKSVAVNGITIASGATNETLDIICIQNLLIQGDGAVGYVLGITYTTNPASGGYSLYLLNCEIGVNPSSTIFYPVFFNPNILTTRYYINNCNINNTSSSPASSTSAVLYITAGQIWSFNNNSLTNKAPATAIPQILMETYTRPFGPLQANSNAKIIGGITNSTFETTGDICLSLLITNGGDAFSLGNNSFKFTTTDALNTTAGLVLGNQNTNTTIGIVNNAFINQATTQTLAQEPFIRLNGATVISQNNNFSLSGFAPTTSSQAILYPVGNYGTNALTNAYGYNNNVYSNKSATVKPIPDYPLSATVVSGLQVSDAQQLTNLNNLTLTNKSNVVGYDTTTKLLTYQPNNKITGLTSATQSNIVGYDTGTGLLTYQPAGGGGVSTVSNGTTYASGYLASIASSTITINAPNQNVNSGSNVSFNQLTIPENASSSSMTSSLNNVLTLTSSKSSSDNANPTLKVVNNNNNNGVIMGLFSPNMTFNQALDMWIGRELSAYYAVNWRFQTYNTVSQPSSLNSMAFLGYGFSHAVWINNYGLRITQGSMSADSTATLLLDEDKAYKPSTSTWTISSDRRIKENIVDADLNICYNTLKKLPIRRFRWKDSYHTYPYDKAMEEKVCDKPEKPNPIRPDLNKVDRHSIGVIADEFEKVFPKACVHRNDFGYDDCKAINIDQLIHSSFGAIKQLQIMVETLQQQVADLQNKNK